MLTDSFFGWEGSPTKIDYRKKVGSLILSSLLEDLVLHLPQRAVVRGTCHPQSGVEFSPNKQFGYFPNGC